MMDDLIKYMIVYDASEKRSENYKVQTANIPNLQKFSAVDTLENFEKNAETAKKKNYASDTYIWGSVCNKYPGKLGCNLSHQILWETFLNNHTENWLMVFEDDVLINEYDTDERFSKILSVAEQNNSNFIQLYTNPGFVSKQSDADSIVGNLYKMIPQWHTVAYAISRTGIELLMELYPVNENIDEFISSNVDELNALCWLNNIFLNGGDVPKTEPIITRRGKKIWIRKKEDTDIFGSIIWDEQL